MAEHGEIWCTQCGTKNAIEEKGTTGAIKACAKCGKQIVRMTALLADLGLYSEDLGVCPKCKHGQAPLHTYCFFCGTEWRAAQKK